MEALRPTKQIVSVLRKHGRMNRRALWEHLVEEQTSSYPTRILLNSIDPILRCPENLIATLAAPDAVLQLILIAVNAAIKSKLHAKDLLRWLVQKNRVQIHMVTKEQARDQAKSKRWEYEVNEFNEQKAERKLKPKYAYPNAKQQHQYQERKEKGTRSSSLTRSSSTKLHSRSRCCLCRVG
jgi:aminopeptidase N